MLRRIEPEVIICYHTPFPEMQGNNVHVDYDLSSWKHEDEDLEKGHETEPCDYWNGDYPDIFSPEWLAEYFTWKQVKNMNETIIIPPGSLNFKTISEFKWSIHYGAEIGFTWNGRNYHVCAKVRPTPEADPMILFYEDYKEETEQWFMTPDDVLDCLIDGAKLREIIKQVEVTERTI